MIKPMSAEACSFKRTQNSKWESGIAINPYAGSHDTQIIIDTSFNPVPTPIFSYTLESYKGCFNFTGTDGNND